MGKVVVGREEGGRGGGGGEAGEVVPDLKSTAPILFWRHHPFIRVKRYETAMKIEEVR